MKTESDRQTDRQMLLILCRISFRKQHIKVICVRFFSFVTINNESFFSTGSRTSSRALKVAVCHRCQVID